MMRSPILPLLILAAILLSPPPASGSPGQDVLHLSLGDPQRSGYEIGLALDTITDSVVQDEITPAELAARLDDVDLLFLGESHTDMDVHNVQRRVIEALVDRGRAVMIGLEMYPYTEQRFLDQWIDGLFTEKGFVEVSDWYRNWGYHWGYYREIFLLARENGIRMVGVNTPREVISAVRRKGFENLSEDEARHIPPRIDTDNEEHLQLFKSYFEGDDAIHSSMSEEQWSAMFAAQCTWDATMGYNAVRALQSSTEPDAIMVVLIGSGHVAYGLGIQRQAALWFDGRMASVIPVAVADEDGAPVDSVTASYADFIWGIPPEVNTVYPSLGISTRFVEEDHTLEVLMAGEGSSGEGAGVQAGDILVSMDGITLTDRATLNRLVAGKSWGDAAELVVRRGGEDLHLTAYFRRTLN
jgi:uncharacterized iron-regulated protein